MIKEYVGSLGSRHGLTKYILSSGLEIILNVEEMEEFFRDSKLGRETEILKAENQKVGYQRDYYKSLIRDFSNILTKMRGV